MNVLFLFESILPPSYHSKTLSPGELRVIAAQKAVKCVYALGRSGKSFYNTSTKNPTKTKLENKVHLVHINGFDHSLWYYFAGILLFVKGYFFLRTHKVSIIHAESPHISGPVAAALGKLFSIPVIVEFRTTYDEILKNRFKFIPVFLKKFVFNTISSFSFNNADLVAANSKTYALVLSKKFPGKLVAFYNPGVKPSKLVKTIRKNITIGFLGRLYPDKGPIYLLRAVDLVQKELRQAKARVLIAGDGPERSLLEEFVKTHNLKGLVKFPGTMQRWDFLSQIDILVNPNIIFSALEMVNIEAGSFSIPTVCFGDKQYPETVVHNKTGIVVKNKDVPALAKAIIALVDDNTFVQKLGRAAKKHSETFYSFKIQVSNLKKIYQTLKLS
ncbi:MAG: glycosyltransferase family 4 protein [Patescibacteria group bacterium]|jgi:glycosyltransferase involved in cell wall biosynthesis